MLKITTALVTALVLASAALTSVANAAPRHHSGYAQAPMGDSLRDTRGGSGF